MDFFSLGTCTITIKSDCTGDLHTQITKKCNTKQRHFNIIGDTQHWLQSTPNLTTKWGHVRGHQTYIHMNDTWDQLNKYVTEFYIMKGGSRISHLLKVTGQ